MKKCQGRLYYFGEWRTDPRGDSALKDWIARKDSILAGLDGLRAAPVDDGMTVGELATRFLADRRTKMVAGDLAKQTYGGYCREIPLFVAEVGSDGIVASLRPQHFQAYADRLIKQKTGRHSRKRIFAYIKAMVRWGIVNGFSVGTVFDDNATRNIADINPFTGARGAAPPGHRRHDVPAASGRTGAAGTR
ncbi:MAG: hypothetical protein ABSD28_19830, partial [Tepidisphaeraceae bacterium]